MSARPSLPRRARLARSVGTVIRITCPGCGRELASATYSQRELLSLHESSCDTRRKD